MSKSDNYPLNHIVPLAKKLIAVPSTAANPQALQEVLHVAKKELEGYFPIEEFESNGIPSLLIHNTDKRTRHFKIILNAHLDVVPAKEDYYYAEEKNGRLYGRGTYDMKPAAAIMILLFKELAKEIQYPLGLQLVTDEEVGGYNGTSYQAKKAITSEFFIMGEPSWLKINNQAKGIVWIKVTAKGKAYHAAYPWKGENAITKMQRLISILEELYPTPHEETWGTTINVTRIETNNTTTNTIPDTCTAYFDIRYVPADKKAIMETIKKVTGNEYEITPIISDVAVHTPQENPFVMKLVRSMKKVLGEPATFLATHGSSDARHYEAVNCPGVCFGPLGNDHHSDNEWVDIKSLEDYYYILKDFLLSIK